MFSIAGTNITPEALFDKIVTKHRGGFCFEQNGIRRKRRKRQVRGEEKRERGEGREN